jgi:hypothetical protein
LKSLKKMVASASFAGLISAAARRNDSGSAENAGPLQTSWAGRAEAHSAKIAKTKGFQAGKQQRRGTKANLAKAE